ncbi:hypothetical protein [Candidatus Pantoea persica]|uniref:hypothetical protein n=1 Tax=Candidatus Pantoea persica TaxID=2518128 RepID=UPI00403DDEAB
MLRQALRRRASGIHIEPQRDGVRVRLRIDGVLQPLASAAAAGLPVYAHAGGQRRRLSPRDGRCITARKRLSACCKAKAAPCRCINWACPPPSGACSTPRWRSRRG